MDGLDVGAGALSGPEDTVSRLLPHPYAVFGYRKDGRPIHPILGASEGDPAQPPVPPVRTFTQDEVSQLLAREKQQGGGAAVNEFLTQLGFAKLKDLTSFVQAQKAAETAQAHRGQAPGGGRRREGDGG